MLQQRSTLLLLLVSSGLVALVFGQSAENPPCFVCGEGNEVADEGNIFTVPEPYATDYNFPEVACGILQTSGEMGLIPEDLCNLLDTETDVREICECVQSTAAPVGRTPKTSNPQVSVGKPDAPTRAPTIVVIQTEPPKEAPTVVVIQTEPPKEAPTDVVIQAPVTTPAPVSEAPVAPPTSSSPSRAKEMVAVIGLLAATLVL